MFKMILMLFWMLTLNPLKALASVHVGTGFSTVTSGRQIPALTLGMDIQGWAVSSMFAGTRTEVYYTSGIMVNALRTKDWGDFWFGRLEVGFGAGGYHAEKGIYTEVDEQGKPIHLEKDQDNIVGPAFRVAFKPFQHMYFSIEYMMGIGTSVLSNAWGDVGLGAVGVVL